MNTLAQHSMMMVHPQPAAAGDQAGPAGPDDVEVFVASFAECDRAALERLADAVDHQVDCAEGEVAWWRATAEVAALLRRQRRSREGGGAARRARDAVLAASTRTGFRDDDRDRTTRLARAAGDAARALVTCPVPTSAVESLLRPFAHTHRT